MAAAADGTVYITDALTTGAGGTSEIGHVWKCTPPAVATGDEFTCVKHGDPIKGARGIAVDKNGVVFVSSSGQANQVWCSGSTIPQWNCGWFSDNGTGDPCYCAPTNRTLKYKPGNITRIESNGQTRILEFDQICSSCHSVTINSITRMQIDSTGDIIYAIHDGELWKIWSLGGGLARQAKVKYKTWANGPELPIAADDIALDLNDNIYVIMLGEIQKWVNPIWSGPWLSKHTLTLGSNHGEPIVASKGMEATTLSVDGDGNIFFGKSNGVPQLLINKTKNLDVDGNGYEEASFFGYANGLPCHGNDHSNQVYEGNAEWFGVDCCPWEHTGDNSQRLIVECPPVKSGDLKQ